MQTDCGSAPDAVQLHVTIRVPRSPAMLQDVAHHADRVHPETVAEWRAWLDEHHDSSDGVWLVLWKKHTGRATVGYDDAVTEAMAEVGVDLSAEFPKPLTDDVVQAADVVITMGCGDACPVYPGKRYLDWTVRDPAGLSVGEVRAIRADIETRVRALLAELVPSATSS